jgi:hypothetical protein
MLIVSLPSALLKGDHYQAFSGRIQHLLAPKHPMIPLIKELLEVILDITKQTAYTPLKYF